MSNPWLHLLISAAIILWAGNRLTRSATVIADCTGLSTAWVGALMLPMVTSLPELVTSTRAAAIGAPDLALGNIFGSNLYNLSLLAAMDLFKGRGTLTARVQAGHVLSASLSVIAICLASLAMVGDFFFPLGWIGIDTVIIAGIYLLGSQLLFRHEKRNMPLLPPGVGAECTPPRRSSLGRGVFQYLIAAVLIITAAIFLTDAADRIAVQTGLGRTFVGSLFLAVSTSLPETVTTLTAVRMGALDMAVANVFGANLTNMFILFLTDLFYRPGPLLAAVSTTHLFSAILVILLSAVVMAGLIYRSQRELIGIGYDSLIVVVGYILGMLLIYAAGGS